MMRHPTLIAQTPNAGARGYRFLTSAPDRIGGDVIAARMGHCALVPMGPDYVAVQRTVTQKDTNRPNATETLMLVGVDVERLTTAECGRLTEVLSGLLNRIDEAISEIDWDADGAELVVPSRRLARWLRSEVGPFPVCDAQSPSVPLPDRRAKLWWTLQRILAVAAVVGIVVAVWSVVDDTDEPPPTKKTTPTSRAKSLRHPGAGR